MKITLRAIKGSPPKFGTVKLVGVYTIIPGFQYQIKLTQEFSYKEVSTTFNRYMKIYVYKKSDTTITPPLGTELPGYHIHQTKSYFPLYEDHEPSKNGYYYSKKLVKGFRTDTVLLEIPEEEEREESDGDIELFLEDLWGPSKK